MQRHSHSKEAASHQYAPDGQHAIPDDHSMREAPTNPEFLSLLNEIAVLEAPPPSIGILPKGNPEVDCFW